MGREGKNQSTMRQAVACARSPQLHTREAAVWVLCADATSLILLVQAQTPWPGAAQ